ncbi:hypothetical protein JHK87_022530 [Glycine soja]|nr:hypothetical protein JHK87_022530 [Glycine soja]
MGPTMVAEARTCESQSHRFKGPCLSDTNCGSVCRTEGFSGGHCRGFSRRCFCTKEYDNYYKSSDVIRCKDGSGKFTKAQLNDDMCDCVDGTNEPGFYFNYEIKKHMYLVPDLTFLILCDIPSTE